MNFREACKRYNLSEEMLWSYKDSGLIVPETENEYTEGNFRHIEVIKMLSEAGMSDEMLRTYLQMLDGNASKEEQVKLLRVFRATLIFSIFSVFTKSLCPQNVIIIIYLCVAIAILIILQCAF